MRSSDQNSEWFESMIFDMDFLAAQTGGDEQLQSELLSLFAAQLDASCARIDAVSDIEAAHDLLHRLKGSARAIGANGLGHRIDRLEQRIGEARSLAPFLDDRDSLRTSMREASICASSLIAARVSPGLAKRWENG